MERTQAPIPVLGLIEPEKSHQEGMSRGICF